MELYQLNKEYWSEDINDWSHFDYSSEYINNPEYIDVKIDSLNKILEGTKQDGTKVIYSNLQVNGNIINKGIQEHIDNIIDNKIGNLDTDALNCINLSKNPEYINLELDSSNKILSGRTNDGMYIENIGLSTPKISINNAIIENIKDPEERIELKTDIDGKIISYRDKRGVLYENVGIVSLLGIYTKSLNTSIINFNTDDDKEKFLNDLNVKQSNLLTEYPINLPHYGELNFILPDASVVNMPDDTDNSYKCLVTGTTNAPYTIVSEEKVMSDDWTAINYNSSAPMWNAGDSYIAKDSPYSYEDSLVFTVLISSISEIDCEHVGYLQFANKYGNVGEKIYISKSDIGNPVTATPPENAWIVKFVYSVDGVNVTQGIDVTYGEVTLKCNGKSLMWNNGYVLSKTTNEYIGVNTMGRFGYIPTLEKWIFWNWSPIQKSLEHKGRIEINIPGFYSGTEYASFKFQGNNTLNEPKKSFRLTLYKDKTYNKKKKVKIGDMIKLSGFNLKAYYSCPTRLNEIVAYRIAHMMWESREYPEQYPWNKDTNIFSGSTGIIKNFPIHLSIDGNFYGVCAFGEKKDEGNYMLDGTDGSGLFVSLGANYAGKNLWSDTNAFLSGLEDEMLKEDEWVNQTDRKTSQSNIDAFTALLNYVNNGMSAATAEQHFDKYAWIDHMILQQVAFLHDSINNNLHFYTGPDKVKFYLFPYDLDVAFGYNPNTDIFSENSGYDTSIYRTLINLWHDDFVERYKELRKTCLSVPVFVKTLMEVSRSIPYSDYEDEVETWGITETGLSANTVSSIIQNFKNRVELCDRMYLNKE